MEAHFYPHIANLPSREVCVVVFSSTVSPMTSGAQQATITRWPSNDLPSLGAKLTALKEEHRKVDQHILTLFTAPGSDKIALQRLKKRKLALKDEIQKLESFILPDIIA